MIITAQRFFNELDLLEIKCEELLGVVDAHLIVESPTTFTNLPKPLYFAENRARFAKYPIIHMVMDLPKVADSPWDREYVVHKAMLAEVRKINPEIAMWLDLDELPRKDTVERFKAMGVKTAHVDMDFILYFFDRLDPTQRGTTAKIGYFDPAAEHQPWRGEFHHPNIANSGWHFSYFGGKELLLEKLSATSHSIEPGNTMKAGVEAGEYPGFERSVPYDLAKLPHFVVENRERFARHFYNLTS